MFEILADLEHMLHTLLWPSHAIAAQRRTSLAEHWRVVLWQFFTCVIFESAKVSANSACLE